MTIRTEYPHQTLRIWTSDSKPVMHLWIGYTPVDLEQKVNRTFGLLSVRRPKISGLLNLAWPALVWFTNRIFAEDRAIIPEMEQAAYDRQGCRLEPGSVPGHTRPACAAGRQWTANRSCTAPKSEPGAPLNEALFCLRSSIASV